MKKAVLLCYLLLACAAWADDGRLAWDSNPTSDTVTAYRVYASTTGTGNWTKIGDVTPVTGATQTYTELNLPPSARYWYVTAVNARGESMPSNIVSVPALPGSPRGATVTIILQIPLGGGQPPPQ